MLCTTSLSEYLKALFHSPPQHCYDIRYEGKSVHNSQLFVHHMNFHYIKTFSLFWGGGGGGGGGVGWGRGELLNGPQRDTLYPKSGAGLGISREEGADFQKKN